MHRSDDIWQHCQFFFEKNLVIRGKQYYGPEVSHLGHPLHLTKESSDPLSTRVDKELYVFYVFITFYGMSP